MISIKPSVKAFLLYSRNKKQKTKSSYETTLTQHSKLFYFFRLLIHSNLKFYQNFAEKKNNAIIIIWFFLHVNRFSHTIAKIYLFL
jgi:hypothetical protein